LSLTILRLILNNFAPFGTEELYRKYKSGLYTTLWCPLAPEWWVERPNDPSKIDMVPPAVVAPTTPHDYLLIPFCFLVKPLKSQHHPSLLILHQPHPLQMMPDPFPNCRPVKTSRFNPPLTTPSTIPNPLPKLTSQMKPTVIMSAFFASNGAFLWTLWTPDKNTGSTL